MSTKRDLQKEIKRLKKQIFKNEALMNRVAMRVEDVEAASLSLRVATEQSRKRRSSKGEINPTTNV